MKINSSFVSLASAFLVLALGVPLTAGADSYQTADFHTFPDGVGLVPAAGTLTRSEGSVTARLYMTGLDRKSAYTVWWIVWNDPSVCASIPCSPVDLFKAGNAIFYATGFVTGTDGAANVVANLNSGAPRDGIQVLFGDGLDAGNGLAAEMHLLVRSHGRILDGLVAAQIGSVEGACDINICVDQIAVAFLP
jgi:hypothetical protein